MDLWGRIADTNRMTTERLQTIRTHWGFGVVEFAEHLGCSEEEMKGYEEGHEKMPQEVKLQLMSLLRQLPLEEVRELGKKLAKLAREELKRTGVRKGVPRKSSLAPVIPIKECPKKVLPMDSVRSITNQEGISEPPHWRQSPHKLLPTKPGTPNHMSTVMRMDRGGIF